MNNKTNPQPQTSELVGERLACVMEAECGLAHPQELSLYRRIVLRQRFVALKNNTERERECLTRLNAQLTPINWDTRDTIRAELEAACNPMTISELLYAFSEWEAFKETEELTPEVAKRTFDHLMSQLFDLWLFQVYVSNTHVLTEGHYSYKEASLLESSYMLSRWVGAIRLFQDWILMKPRCFREAGSYCRFVNDTYASAYLGLHPVHHYNCWSWALFVHDYR